MDWIFFEIKEQNLLSPSPSPTPTPTPTPFLLSQPPPPPLADLQSGGFNFNKKVSPSILLIIIILAIIFFICGLLHLLIRYLLRPQNRNPDDSDDVTALQGQLQQLFHLHDSGVDQSFIDTLPVFNYKAIIGVKNPFDCAVCLCEFEPEDKLRLLPKCSHAFHMECIDTWLLSHSTCPLCRATLLPDFSPTNNCCSPIVLVLESGSDSSREIVSDRDGGVLGTNNSVARANSHLGFHCREEFGDLSDKSDEIPAKDHAKMAGSEEKVVAVKLGKFRNVDGRGEGSSNNDAAAAAATAARRCFSMGSFAYVMDENSSLQVPIRTPMKKQQSSKKSCLPLTPGHRPAMSECDCDSRRHLNGFEPFEVHGIGTSGSISTGNGNGNGNAIGRSKRDSFSISKIWLRAKKEKPHPMAVEPSRRAFSFRFPVHQSVVSADYLNPKSGGCGTRRTTSEIDIGRWENGGGTELGCDEENQSCNSSDSQPKTPSFATRTMLWLVGRQNKKRREGGIPTNTGECSHMWAYLN